ncbi:MAG: FixH family protein [Campylobacterales bacterium]
MKRLFKVLLAVGLSATAVWANWQAQGKAGGYEVSIQTAKAPVSGANDWVVKLTQNGKPVENAKVDLKVWMPAMPPAMPYMETKGALAAKGGGEYAGMVEIIHGGTWRVNVSIEADGKSAEYKTSLRF